MSKLECTCLVVGGGIAGVSCVENLSFLAPHTDIIFLTESPLIKAVSSLVQLGKWLQKFDVVEKQASSLSETRKQLTVIQDRLLRIDSKAKECTTERGTKIKYSYLCLCTGARPKLIDQSKNSSRVIGIRDTDSVVEFQKHIKTSKSLAVVGNGGIASEIVHEAKGIKIHWIVKDNHIASTFVDPGAAKFFQDNLNDNSIEPKHVIKRMRYETQVGSEGKIKGAALGPDWHRKLDITGKFENVPDRVKVYYNCEVSEICENDNAEYPVQITLTNGEKIACDFIVSATGVNPCIDYDVDVAFERGSDGGLLVDEFMKTSLDHIYAAGDICFAGWPHAQHWFQMRLWTQARQMGAMAARSIAGEINKEPVLQDFCFELFGHVTELFGYQVVLLGKYNGQGLGNKFEMLVRVTPKKEYIKFILQDGKLQGAILIGETGLEETSENLILNQLDLTPYGDDILNPDIDIEDYFD